MELSPEAVAVIVTSVLTAFGIGKGAEAFIARRAAARKAASGEIEALDFITESDCRGCRKEIMEGITRLEDVFRGSAEAESAAIQELKTSVAVLTEKFESQSAEAVAGTLREISSHERRFHAARIGTADYSRGGGR